MKTHDVRNTTVANKAVVVSELDYFTIKLLKAFCVFTVGFIYGWYLWLQTGCSAASFLLSLLIR